MDVDDDNMTMKAETLKGSPSKKSFWSPILLSSNRKAPSIKQEKEREAVAEIVQVAEPLVPYKQSMREQSAAAEEAHSTQEKVRPHLRKVETQKSLLKPMNTSSVRKNIADEHHQNSRRKTEMSKKHSNQPHQSLVKNSRVYYP